MTTNTLPIPILAGPSHVCTSGSTYTIQNAPQGLHITWQVSPGHWFHSTTQNGTGASAAIMAASNTVGGIGQLQFTMMKEEWFTVKLM
ncbi:MAG: hypothetical protein JJU28_04890 [Cyclobacteriaceae bacterium]|nr:hypothetical protein [Cyclobacteriaceae bacterium]